MNIRLPALLASLLFAISHADAQTITVTTVTNPPQGGTMTGAGVYSQGSNPTITIQAATNWYISNVRLNGGIALMFDVALVSTEQQGGDVTTITNDTEKSILTSDSTYTAFFAPLSPTFSQLPTNVAAVTGGQATLSAAATGRRTIQYQWQGNGQNLTNATNASLSFTNLSPANSGTYTVVASNAFGTNSASAELLVKDLLVLVNGQPATNAVTNIGQALVSLQSRYTNGPIFYTLNGNAPDSSGTPYTGPFFVSSTSTIRAIGYRSDFLATALSDTIPLTVIPTYTFTLDSSGGGMVDVNPPGFAFTNGTILTLTATPASGWTFMGWVGELSGTSPTNTIVITHNTTANVLFGTTLDTSSVGNGTITVSPNFPLYPYSSEVTLEAVPTAGSYFAAWGGALSGNQIPQYLNIYSPTQTVSALFATLPAGTVTLTVLANGGFVYPAVATNLYPVGGTNELFAYPYSGQQFLGWSGDASGTNNPLAVVMTKSKVITANFSETATLYAAPNANTLDLSLYSVPGTVYQIDTSSNLTDWIPFLIVTNFYNPLNFSDSVRTNVPARFYRATSLP